MGVVQTDNNRRFLPDTKIIEGSIIKKELFFNVAIVNTVVIFHLPIMNASI